MSDTPLTKCIKCGGRLEKQWSSTSFQLKGTGWYVTDYAAKKSETKTESKDAKATSTEGGSEKSEETTTKTDGKSSTTDSETKAIEKPTAVRKKGPSKDVSSKSSGD